MSDDDYLVGALREFYGDLVADGDFPSRRERIREAADRLEQLIATPKGSLHVEVAVAISEGGHVATCPISPYYKCTDTPAKALEDVRRPMNVAVGIISGWVRRLSDAEQWELRTPKCDKRHKKNPFPEAS